MSSNIQALLQQRRISYEVSPYYVICEQRPAGCHATSQRVLSGFDLDIYDKTPDSEADDALQQIARQISSPADAAYSVDVIPFPSTLFLDTRDHLEPQSKFRIRIAHSNGLDKPAGEAEQSALAQIETQLQKLGIPRR